MAPKLKLASSEQTTKEGAEGVASATSSEDDEMSRWHLEHTRRFVEYLESVGLLANDPHLASLCQDLRPVQGSPEDSAPALKKPRTVCDGMISKHLQARASLLKPGLGCATPVTNDVWHKEAVIRWGNRVPDQKCVADWKSYVTSRLPVVTPLSPLDIMQERYAYDAWRLLVACALMTRISSERIKEKTIATFFLRFPTPSAFLAKDADGESVLQDIVRPLGMMESRCKTLAELSQRFLQMPVFDVGNKKGVNKVFGLGPFAVDSYLIFCRGVILPEVADSLCQEYVDWRKSNCCEGAETSFDLTSTIVSSGPKQQHIRGDEEKENAELVKSANSKVEAAPAQKQSSLFGFFKSSKA